MSIRLIQDLHAGISRRDWNAVEAAANRLRDDVEETRRILAGTGIGSLPNDYPLSRLATEAKKDGGQEVEAATVLGYVREAGLRSLSERNHTSIYPSPDEERGYIIPVYAQPASTALVERLIRKAGQVEIDELIERMDGKHPGDDDLADYLTRIVDACARAALSASSREGESRG